MKFIYTFSFILLLLFVSSCVEDKANEINLNEIDLSDVTLTVNEDAAVGSTIGEINLTNNSSISVNTFITAGNEDGTFALTNTTLTLAKPLDFETKMEYKLNIEASANGQTANAVVTVNIEDGEHNFNFEGTVYEFADGLIDDYGLYEILGTQNHYNYDFVILDQPITIVNDAFNLEDVKIVIVAGLYSSNTSGFQGGLFNYIDTDQATANDIEGKNFSDYLGIILLDGMGNEVAEYDAVTGSINVIDNGDLNYTLEFDIDIQKYKDDETGTLDPSTEQNVKFTYSGTFQYNDERDAG